MEAHPFVINKDASGEDLQPIDRRSRAYDEAWLQELLRQHPNILPTAEIEPIFYPLTPIGREVVTDTGAIDNLFISHRGYMVLVETKLWRNPQARREVVAQAIDYGSSIAKWSYARLNEAVQAYTRKYEDVELGLIDWIEQQWGPVEGGRDFFEETVTKNLRLGRFLTLIVGDRIRQSVIEMLDWMNRYPHLATDVALVELRCYQWEQNKRWPLLVVPRVMARTEVIERSIVQVTVQQGGTYEIDVRQERATQGKPKRTPLTEEAFWELLAEYALDDYEAVRQLIDRYREKDGIEIAPMERSLVVRLDIQDTDQQASLFFVDTYARVHIWFVTIGNQLTRAGIHRHLAQSYGVKMREILCITRELAEPARAIADVDIDEFTSAVDSFIEEIQIAERAG